MFYSDLKQKFIDLSNDVFFHIFNRHFNKNIGD